MIGIPRSIAKSTGVVLDVAKARLVVSQIVADGLLSGERPQLCLNSRKGSTDPLYEGAGLAIYPEEEFTEINRLFAGTIFEDILHECAPIGRARLMFLEPRRSYSIHQDTEERIHFAIETNPQAILLVASDQHRMWRVHVPDDGMGYRINTRLPHSALNGGTEPRIHLLLNVR